MKLSKSGKLIAVLFFLPLDDTKGIETNFRLFFRSCFRAYAGVGLQFFEESFFFFVFFHNFEKNIFITFENLNVKNTLNLANQIFQLIFL